MSVNLSFDAVENAEQYALYIDAENADLIAWLEANATFVETDRVTIDLTAVSAFNSLKPGVHKFQVQARAENYQNSDLSEAVEYQVGISFSIDGTTYYAEEGSTWATWCADSTLNPDGYKVDEYVYSASDGEVQKDGASLFGTDTIIEGAAYTVATKKLLTFEINDALGSTDYITKEFDYGMTWADYVASSYNTDGWTVSGDHILMSSSFKYWVGDPDDSQRVDTTDTIIDGHKYVILTPPW